uniref:Uncharacterized protein n=1 Tax=Arundo donax TaxID=35708 RepID=A0A0A9G6A0_ARUDO
MLGNKGELPEALARVVTEGD